MERAWSGRKGRGGTGGKEREGKKGKGRTRGAFRQMKIYDYAPAH